MLSRVWLELSVVGVLGDGMAFWIMTLKLFKTPVISFLAAVIHTWSNREGQEISHFPWELMNAEEGRIKLCCLSFDA